MTYTADPLDPTKPTNGGDKARYAADELRAIKTKLVEHEQAVLHTLPDALMVTVQAFATFQNEVNDALDLQASKRVRLSGSGTFTVPEGVTFLAVTAQPGMNGRLYRVADNVTVQAEQAVAETKYLVVTPGQVISFAQGTDATYTAVGALAALYPPTDTTFGSLTWTHRAFTGYSGVYAGAYYWNGFYYVNCVLAALPQASGFLTDCY